MYIANQQFDSEEQLLENLFDFSLGEATESIKKMISEIDAELLAHKEFQAYRATLSDEEDIEELDHEERQIRLAERLLAMYTSFEVLNSKLFGIKNETKTLLYSIDLF